MKKWILLFFLLRSGEKMIRTLCSPTEVDCKSLTPGFYILELVSEEIKIQISFMKQ